MARGMIWDGKAPEKKHILQVSSSICGSMGYLEHCKEPMQRLFQGIKKVLHIPYAYVRDEWNPSFKEDAYADWNSATDRCRGIFAHIGIELHGIQSSNDPQKLIRNAEGIFVSGGNTFYLLSFLHRGLLECLQEVIGEGVPYMGSSAGSNIACPTIKTTNDMPIDWPLDGLDALGVVPFQINPHYTGDAQIPGHNGETRLQRLREYCKCNDTTVICLPEDSWIYTEGDVSRYYSYNGSSGHVMIPGGDSFDINSGSQI